ncbi:hypothetical protein [Ruficoccus sp. ZRK36]|uniref:hypothetical protein n=1 Tax=Ruficoccus sp. ZRK36 TaxID=2866311 RepID=UPI001C73A84B|nr:hypothetical protein [Ruficoccus sp. ZRK36]QYY34812.1 hypothetical protein K0V07_10925 [Ruficoccus sp. ZRK36]
MDVYINKTTSEFQKHPEPQQKWTPPSVSSAFDDLLNEASQIHKSLRMLDGEQATEDLIRECSKIGELLVRFINYLGAQAFIRHQKRFGFGLSTAYKYIRIYLNQDIIRLSVGSGTISRNQLYALASKLSKDTKTGGKTRLNKAMSPESVVPSAKRDLNGHSPEKVGADRSQGPLHQLQTELVSPTEGIVPSAKGKSSSVGDVNSSALVPNQGNMSEKGSLQPTQTPLPPPADTVATPAKPNSTYTRHYHNGNFGGHNLADRLRNFEVWLERGGELPNGVKSMLKRMEVLMGPDFYKSSQKRMAKIRRR